MHPLIYLSMKFPWEWGDSSLKDGSIKREAFLPAGQNDGEGMEPAHF
jgi:hypothetical protein